MLRGAESDLAELASRWAGMAKAGEQVEVYLSRGTETEIRAYQGEIEHLSSATSSGVGIRVVSSNRQGFAYTGYIDEKAMERTLQEARDNVRFATPDEHVGLGEPDGLDPAELPLWDASLLGLDTQAKVDLAIDLERRTRFGDPRVRQVQSADYGDFISESAIATSTGIVASARRTICSMSVSAIAGELDDSHTGVGITAGRGPGDLDLESASFQAIERSTRLLGARKISSRKVPVIFDPRVCATVLSVISSALSGEAVTKGRSMFAGRIGEEVASGLVTIVDDPTDPRAFGASPVDAEGFACRKNVLIEEGVLKSFVFDTTSARRARTRTTASAVRSGYASTPIAGCRALVLAEGTADQAQILENLGESFYVQSVTGVHSGVNPVSGDFSVGAEGFLVRDGTLAEPVREVTIASTLQRMLHAVLHIGLDVEWLPGIAAGRTLAIDGMSIGGS